MAAKSTRKRVKQATKRGRKARTGPRTPKRRARLPQGKPGRPAPPNQWGVVVVAPERFLEALRHPETVYVPLTGGYDQDLFEDGLGRRLIVRNGESGVLAVGRAVASDPGGVTLGALWRPDPSYRLSTGQYRLGHMVVVDTPNLPPKAKYIIDRLK